MLVYHRENMDGKSARRQPANGCVVANSQGRHRLQERSRSTLRGAINVAMNGLARQGVIAGFETNFNSKTPRDPVRITVTANHGADIPTTRAEVMKALGPAGDDVEVAVSSTAD
jgi:hypothetical protein